MKRREFLSFLGKATASLGVASTVSTPLYAMGKSKKKMNVLFIPVDDLRVQLNCYGQKQIISPNIDKLASEGTMFERAYCQQAVCSPSRTSLLTGLRPDSTQVFDLHTFFRDKAPNEDVKTLPQYFKENGYFAQGLGKVYHGHLDDPRSWSTPVDYVRTAEYLDSNSIKIVEKNKEKAKALGLKGKAFRQMAHGPAYEHPDVADDAYRDGKIAKKAIELLRQFKKENKLFFLAPGFIKPHLPFTVPQKYWDMYDHDKINLADNPWVPKGGYPKFAGSTWGELRAYFGMPKEGPVSDEEARNLIHAYYACVTYVDAQIGKVLDELDRLGLRENTIIVLWGDHGWKLGEHGMWAKHTNFDLDTHAPLIVSAPGYPKGQKSNALVEFVDIYPTLCDLAGLPKPKHLEGTSFEPLLRNPKLPWKQAAFSQYPRWGGKLMGYSMRTDKYRFTEWIRGEKIDGKFVYDYNKVKARELYDHTKDPEENYNLAKKPEYADIIKQLHKQLKAGWKGAQVPE